jgi:predicted transcriptional regulator YheO
MALKTVRRTGSDLAAFFCVADGLAALFRPFVEAVVHDLATDSIVHVAHPFSPREVGDPSDLKEIKFAPDAKVIGPYEKINWDGRCIKSISVVLRDSAGKAIGLLCINADVTEFDAARRMLQGFLGVSETSAGVEPAFRDDWHEKINRFVAAWTAERHTTLDRLDRDARRALIAALHETGGFEGRRAPAYVAKILGVSRATVYNELARAKEAIAA